MTTQDKRQWITDANLTKLLRAYASNERRLDECSRKEFNECLEFMEMIEQEIESRLKNQ